MASTSGSTGAGPASFYNTHRWDTQSRIGELSAFKVDDPDSFIRKTISIAQAKLRLNYLDRAEDNCSPLSPKSVREQIELGEFFSSRVTDAFNVKINRRAPSLHYTIQLKEDPLKTFKDCDRHLQTMTKALISAASSRNILMTYVTQPDVPDGDGMEWYRATTFAQMETVMNSDFLDALKHTYIANLSLLRSARYLHKNTEIFTNILELHSGSYRLYDDQVECGRTCEMSILDHSELTRGNATRLRDTILTCGPRLDVAPADFVSNVDVIMRDEAQQALILYSSLHKSFDHFLEKIQNLGRNIKCSIEKIAEKQTTFLNLANDFDTIIGKKLELEAEERKILQKLAAAEDARNKEINSRRTETSYTPVTQTIAVPVSYVVSVPVTYSLEIPYSYTKSWFWGLFKSTYYGTRTETRVTTRSETRTAMRSETRTAMRSETRTTLVADTRMIQDDYGSAKLQAEYEELKRLMTQNSDRLQEQQTKLRLSLKEHAQGYTEEELREGASSLAAALVAVYSLEQAIMIKKTQVEEQMNLIEYKLALEAPSNPNEQEIKTSADAIFQLCLLRDKILSSHAIWIQSHRQLAAIQSIHKAEAEIRLLLSDDITQGTHIMANKIDTEIGLIRETPDINAPNHPIGNKFLTVKELLAQELD
jgi:hypothetical protein